MLQKTGPNRYRETQGETVTVAAIAQNNSGVESATFRYGNVNLTTRPVQGHPGCDFIVDPGVKTFGTTVLFVNGAASAQYDLFEEDDLGNLVDLRFSILQPFGPVAQFQVDGVPMAAVAPPPAAAAAAPRGMPAGAGAPAAPARSAPKPAPKSAKKAKKKSARKKPAVGRAKTARKTPRTTATSKAGKSRTKKGAGSRRTPARRRGR